MRTGVMLLKKGFGKHLKIWQKMGFYSLVDAAMSIHVAPLHYCPNFTKRFSIFSQAHNSSSIKLAKLTEITTST